VHEALDVVDLGLGALLGADGLEHLEGFIGAAAGHQPAGGFRHPQHPEEQGEGGQGGHGQHDPPDPLEVPQRVPKDRVDDDRGQLPEDHHHLVAPGQGAADLVGGELGEEHRHHGGGSADGQAQDDPPGDQQAQPWGEHAQHGAEEEHHGEQEDGPASTPRIGDVSDGQGADGRGEQQGGGHHALGDLGEPELGGHGQQGSVDDAGVVAEQQAAQCGDQGDHGQPVLMGSAAQRREVRGGGGAWAGGSAVGAHRVLGLLGCSAAGPPRSA